MPIKRFGSTLISEGNFDNYMDKLCNAFDKNNLENIMCKNLISVSFDGFIYDCDFNQMLGLNSKKMKQNYIYRRLTLMKLKIIKSLHLVTVLAVQQVKVPPVVVHLAN